MAVSLWAFTRVERIEQARSGRWYALVTLTRGTIAESFLTKFQSQPTNQNAIDAGTALATAFNTKGGDDEFEVLIATLPAVLVLSWQTNAQLSVRFRAAYKVATLDRAARMAYWIIERIVAGDFTDAQVQTVFGLTSGQYTTEKAKLQAMHDHWVAVIAAAGD